MSNNYILVISNKQETGAIISEKIRLLRECDVVKVVSYIESISVLNSLQPSIIMLYCSNEDSVNIVSEIRKIKTLDKVPIIFIMDTFVEDMLLYAFDSGIDDFFFLSDPDSIILTRIFLTIQKSVLYKQIETNNDVLAAANIIDKETGVYSKEQTPAIYRKFFDKCCEENMENTVFMYLKPVASEKKRISSQMTAKKIKSILRGNDAIAYGKNLGFYIILYNAGIKGTQTVFNRIKNCFKGSFDVYAAAVEITADFDKLESVLLKALKEQINNGTDFSYVKDIALLDKSAMPSEREEARKKYKDLKKEFFDSLDKIIAPVFYRFQTLAAQELPEADVNYNISSSESIFSIKQKDMQSDVIITFPAYIKLIVDIKHSEKNSSPSVKRLTFEINEFSEEKLTSILRDLISEFNAKQGLSKIYSDESL